MEKLIVQGLGKCRLVADSVEKLDRSVHRCPVTKIDLSDRPKIYDCSPGNGLTTPANVPNRAPFEFFNRIGRIQKLKRLTLVRKFFRKDSGRSDKRRHVSTAE